MDYIFRWLDLRFLTGEQQSLFDDLRPRPHAQPAVAGGAEQPASGAVPQIAASTQPGLFERGAKAKTGHAADALSEYVDMGDAPSCAQCGAIMTRNGSCFRCMSCGSTSGCS